MTRTILLIGGTQFIGRNLAVELEHAGHRVIVGGKLGPEAHADTALPSTTSLKLPLAGTDAIVSLVRREGVQTVVHMASAMKPSSTLADYAKEQAEIAVPTMELGVCLAAMGVELIFLSSGGTVYGQVSDNEAHEDDVCRPINYYGLSKLGIENGLAFLQRTKGLRFLILRVSNPYGRFQDLRGTQGIISVALGKMIDGKPLEVWGDGTNVRDYIYIDDLTATIRSLIESEVRGLTVNLGSGVGHSLVELVDIVRRVTGRPLDLLFHAARAVDVPRLVLNVSRLRDLGFDYSRSLESGIREYAAELGIVDG